MTQHPFRIAQALVLAAFIVIVAGCATGGGGTRKAAAGTTVEERAVARWKLLIAKDFAGAWEYLSPGVKSTKPQDRYAAELVGRPVTWKNVELLDKTCESDDSCKVSLRIDYEVTLPAAGVGKVKLPAPLEEQWVRVKGQWYHVPANIVRGGLR